MNDKKTPDEWLRQPQYHGVVVLDPDGWNRKNFAASWAEPIEEVEFIWRLSISTSNYRK